MGYISLGCFFLGAIFLAGLWDMANNYSTMATIIGYVIIIGLAALAIFLIWLFGWFGNMVDTKKQVDKSYRRIEDRNGDKWDKITRDRTRLDSHDH